MRAVRVIDAAGMTNMLRPFIRQLVELGKTPDWLANVADLAVETGRADLSIFAAKRAESEGVALVEAGFPVIETRRSAAVERTATTRRGPHEGDRIMMRTEKAEGPQEPVEQLVEVAGDLLGVGLVAQELLEQPVLVVQIPGQGFQTGDGAVETGQQLIEALLALRIIEQRGQEPLAPLRLGEHVVEPVEGALQAVPHLLVVEESRQGTLALVDPVHRLTDGGQRRHHRVHHLTTAVGLRGQLAQDPLAPFRAFEDLAQ